VRWFAKLVLVAVIVSAFVPMIGEFINVLRERVVLDAALVNSARAANNNAMNIWHMMMLDAVVNEDDFIRFFSESFSDSLGLSYNNAAIGNPMVFTSDSGRFNDITVSFAFDFNFVPSGGDVFALAHDDRSVTLVTLEMETPYLFRTFWLRTVNGASNDNFLLRATRPFIVQVVN